MSKLIIFAEVIGSGLVTGVVIGLSFATLLAPIVIFKAMRDSGIF